MPCPNRADHYNSTFPLTRLLSIAWICYVLFIKLIFLGYVSCLQYFILANNLVVHVSSLLPWEEEFTVELVAFVTFYVDARKCTSQKTVYKPFKKCFATGAFWIL